MQPVTHHHKIRQFWPLAALWLAAVSWWQVPPRQVASRKWRRLKVCAANQLTGFGLWLPGCTGDQTTQMPYHVAGITNYLQQLGITLPACGRCAIAAQNVRRVLVMAPQLPAFARPGQTVDVNVSSYGQLKSLKAGCDSTPLKGADVRSTALARAT